MWRKVAKGKREGVCSGKSVKLKKCGTWLKGRGVEEGS